MGARLARLRARAAAARWSARPEMVRADRPRHPHQLRVSRRGALGPAGQGWEPLVTHNQPLISSYNQQQTTTQSLLLTADSAVPDHSDLRPATRDTCLNTTARTLVTRAVSGTGAEDNMKLELENNLTFVPGTAIVRCHVSRVYCQVSRVYCQVLRVT